MTDFYRGKRVYITGGSSGIGLACAEELAAAGAHVAIFARDVAKKDGGTFTAYDVAVTRSFKADDGAWGRTKTLEANDLLDLAFAAEDAHRELLAHKTKK